MNLLFNYWGVNGFLNAQILPCIHDLPPLNSDLDDPYINRAEKIIRGHYRIKKLGESIIFYLPVTYTGPNG